VTNQNAFECGHSTGAAKNSAQESGDHGYDYETLENLLIHIRKTVDFGKKN